METTDPEKSSYYKDRGKKLQLETCTHTGTYGNGSNVFLQNVDTGQPNQNTMSQSRRPKYEAPSP